MPEYKYECNDCNFAWYEKLQISSDPKATIDCPFCGKDGSRKIGFKDINKKNQIVIKKGTTVGDWFKKETGKDLLGE